MLEVVFLASHLLWMMAREDIETLYDLATVNAGKAMNVPLKLAVGNPAHLVMLAQNDVLDAVRFHTAPACVISHGKVVDLGRMRELSGQPAV
jgi:cytosine deaminase